MRRGDNLSDTQRYLRGRGVQKMCGDVMCNNKIPVGDKYCLECKESKGYKENDTERHKNYNKYRRDSQSQRFYESAEWRGRVGKIGKREEIIQRDEGLCQQCLRKGITRVGDIVHHKKELKERWDLRLVSSNLEYVCHSCHNKEHGKRRW